MVPGLYATDVDGILNVGTIYVWFIFDELGLMWMTCIRFYDFYDLFWFYRRAVFAVRNSWRLTTQRWDTGGKHLLGFLVHPWPHSFLYNLQFPLIKTPTSTQKNGKSRVLRHWYVALFWEFMFICALSNLTSSNFDMLYNNVFIGAWEGLGGWSYILVFVEDSIFVWVR